MKRLGTVAGPGAGTLFSFRRTSIASSSTFGCLSSSSSGNSPSLLCSNLSSTLLVSSRSRVNDWGRRGLAILSTSPSSPRGVSLTRYRHRSQRIHSSSPILHVVSYSTTTEKDKEKEKEEEKKDGKIKTFIKKYGPVGVVTYFAIYGITLGSFYLAFDHQLIKTVDVLSFLDHIPLHDYIGIHPSDVSTSKVGAFAQAWIITKLTEPLRLGITITLTPGIRRFLESRGLIARAPLVRDAGRQRPRAPPAAPTNTPSATPPSSPPSTAKPPSVTPKPPSH